MMPKGIKISRLHCIGDSYKFLKATFYEWYAEKKREIRRTKIKYQDYPMKENI